MLTNKIMAEKLSIPISKVRRNTKEFLGEDPKATRRSGYKREFSLNEGFFVYLGGELVSKYGLTFGNARRAIDVIKPWLLKNQLVPEPPKGALREGVDAKASDFYLTFYVSEGQISEICEIRVVEKSDIAESLEDSTGRKYHTLSTNEYYYGMRNNQGKIQYFVPETKVSRPGLTIRLTIENEEIEKIWKRARKIGEVPISALLNNFNRLVAWTGL
jgi:hypothetical protein